MSLYRISIHNVFLDRLKDTTVGFSILRVLIIYAVVLLVAVGVSAIILTLSGKSERIHVESCHPCTDTMTHKIIP